MGIAGILITIVLLGIIVSTTETRAAGRKMMRPYAAAAGVLTFAFWGLVLLFR